MSRTEICKRVVVTGRVQGVWYRGAMQQEALRLGLSGWVKNLPDGRVEAVVEGPGHLVDELVRWCASGPPAAHVVDVTAHDEPVTGYTGFDVRY